MVADGQQTKATELLSRTSTAASTRRRCSRSSRSSSPPSPPPSRSSTRTSCGTRAIGNLACLNGLPERLEAELVKAAQASPHVSIFQHARRLGLLVGTTHERRHGAWMGASILGSMATHQELWMSRAEYDEYGAALIARRGMQYAW